MAPIKGLRRASLSLQVAVVVAVIFTGLATWICYVQIADVAPSAAQPVVWLGLAALLFEISITGWFLRAVAKMETQQRQARMQFVAAAIHDLRQPMQAATLFMDSLNHASPDPQPSKAAQGLDQSLQSVRHILDDLLDLSSLDAGAVRLKKQVFNVAALLHALEAEFAAPATAKNLRFCFYCPSTDIGVHGDPQWVQTILRKLLINAIAKTQQGGVLLGLRQRAGMVIVQVWDTHTSQAPAASSRSARGLAIASRVAELMQSPLHFESKMGRGAVCTLTLPRDSAPHLSPSAEVQK